MIEPVKTNTTGVGGSYGYATQSKQKKEKPEEETPVISGENQRPVSGDKVLNYLAQSAVPVMPPVTTIDTSKYVDKTSEERIAEFVSGFEGIVAKNLKAISEEFSNMPPEKQQKLGIATQQAIALAMTEKQFQDSL